MEQVLPAVAMALAVCCWPGRSSAARAAARHLTSAWRGDRRPPHGRAASGARPEGGSAVEPGRRRLPFAGRNRTGRRPQRGRSGAPGVGPLEVAATMDLLALLSESGRAVLEGLERLTAHTWGPVQADLATVTAAHAWGLPPRQAWSLLGPDWQRAAAALTLAATAGVPPSRMLTRAAADLRASVGDRLDEAAARLGVRLVLPLGLAFLPAFVLLTVVPLVVSLAGRLLGGP